VRQMRGARSGKNNPLESRGDAQGELNRPESYHYVTCGRATVRSTRLNAPYSKGEGEANSG
jgi:hypothetical protein